MSIYSTNLSIYSTIVYLDCLRKADQSVSAGQLRKSAEAILALEDEVAPLSSVTGEVDCYSK